MSAGATGFFGKYRDPFWPDRGVMPALEIRLNRMMELSFVRSRPRPFADRQRSL
jgi:hypothetical protein